MSSTIKLTLPDGSVREVASGITVLEFAASIGPRLAKDALAGKSNDTWIDLRAPLTSDMPIRIITVKDAAGVEVIRHSAEHIMADAVQRLFPKVQIDAGRSDHSEKFQYDFDNERPFTVEDLAAIENEMQKIIAEDAPFERVEVSRAEAMKFFKDLGQTYKLKRIEDIPEGAQITLFKHGKFADLCRGPHVDRAGRVKAFKLTEVSGAYWKGKEENPMMQRIMGTAFAKKEDLDAHLTLLEEASKRDHRRLGRELDLFSIHDDIGGGLVLWHPKGARVRRVIEDYARREHERRGYEWVFTPHLGRSTLWETSGHLSFYKDGMYPPMELEEQTYYCKPMNCPFHVKIFDSRKRSYRELPLRLAELGTVYRFERSGVLHGLMRVRGFTQDDTHIFCTSEQVEDEIVAVLDFVFSTLRTFGFDEFKAFVATKPAKATGADADWDKATAALKAACVRHGLPYEVDPGGGAFYGPKIDIKIKDAIGRDWQLSTVQFDFNLPEKFDIGYVGSDNAIHRPFMVHRALFGSIERFFGILLEHYAGAFPLWLAPLQVMLLPVTDRAVAHSAKVANELREAGFRIEVDESSEKLGYKIRQAQLAKVPYMLIVGDREVEQGGVSPRRRSGEDLGTMSVAQFIEQARADMDVEMTSGAKGARVKRDGQA